ncbi:MAG: LytTR family DNA-binding domain-containing protein [Bacteroidota bacterium]
MNILIVEDERFARQSLIKLLKNIDVEINILAALESVEESVAWLSKHQADLIFLDIHLADDVSFKIFESVEVKTPIIFTTAYDQYALQAFKVNSVDYILKPIEEEELRAALDKFNHNYIAANLDYTRLATTLEEVKQRLYQERFLVSRRDKIMSITVDQIAYFEGEDRYVYLIKKDGSKFILDYKLSDLEKLLNPKSFFRLNRSFISHFDSIDKIIALSKSRLKVELTPKARRDIFVSAANNRGFKLWLNQ